MNKKLLVAMISACILAGCGSDSSGDSGDGGSVANLGWGAQNMSMSEVETLIVAVPGISNKPASEDGGQYYQRSFMSTFKCEGDTAYWSEHFEIAGVDNKVEYSKLQRIAARAEVNLKMYADELGVSPELLITAAVHNRIGICVEAESGSHGSAYASELSLYSDNPYGGIYEYQLHKHELAHIIDAQFNHNQSASHLTPGWWVEGFAEYASGSKVLSHQEWVDAHNQYADGINIIENGGANGGYKAYSLYATIVAYLYEQGFGEADFKAFVKTDKWHVDSALDLSGCPEINTGACNLPVNVEEQFVKRFDQIASNHNEPSSFIDFRDNYKTYIENWLKAK